MNVPGNKDRARYVYANKDISLDYDSADMHMPLFAAAKALVIVNVPLCPK